MKIDYDSVRRNAKKLRALADNCETTAKNCRRCQSELSQYWQGGAAAAYAAGLAQLDKKNAALAKQIEQMAATITRVADEMEAEDRALATKIAARAATGVSRGVSSSAKPVSSPVKSVADTVKSAVTTATAKSNVSTLASQAFDLVSQLFGRG